MNDTLFAAINNLADHVHWLDLAMVFASKYLPVVFAVVLLVYYLSFQATRQRVAVVAGISTVIALGIAQGIAFLFPEPRPYMTHLVHLLIARSSDPSFPSDHATFSFAIATFIFLHNRRVGLLLLGLAALIGFSRVYVGTHYPMDVIGGAVLGVSVSLLIDRLSRQGRMRAWLDRLFELLSRWHLAGRPQQV